MSPDILCLSHLRWDHVYQRPNHLMSRAARDGRVFFIEEPVYDVDEPWLERFVRDGVDVVVPHLDETRPTAEQLRWAVDTLMRDEGIRAPILWYYTPMALPWTRHLHPTASLTVYDCMDHLAGFIGAPAALLDRERELMGSADVLFTGGASLHEAKSAVHPDAHCFPSSVDVAHFAQARDGLNEPADQAGIPSPRVGYFGVLDERIDWALLDAVIDRRPDLQFVMVGPTVKVDPKRLPSGPNVHYLGPKSYAELPDYLGGWDVAMMPFALNEATRYISPTKTPEYLAGGRPVVSTPIRDVVAPYGHAGLVHIATDAEGFSAAIDRALAQDLDEHRERADRFLATNSWDHTWAGMAGRMRQAMARRGRRVELASVPRTRPARPMTTIGTSGSVPVAAARRTGGRPASAPEVGVAAAGPSSGLGSSGSGSVQGSYATIRGSEG